MNITFLTQAAQLGGTVFTVVAFLWFLSKLLTDQNERQSIRDREAIVASNRESDTRVILAKALEKLSGRLISNTITNTENTEVIKENVVAVIDNTKAVSKKV